MVVRSENHKAPLPASTLAKKIPAEEVRPRIMDKAYILSIPHYKIFDNGIIKDTELHISSKTGKKWKWIAVKSGNDEWCVYCSPNYWTDETIKGLGEKVRDLNVVKLLVRCTDDALCLYQP